MKKLLIIMVFLMFGVSKAQEKLPVNEVRVDALKGIGWTTLGVSYERIIKEDMGLGLSLDVNFSKSDYPKFVGTPYFRFYFLDTKVLGIKSLFIETFASLVDVSYKEEVYGTSSSEPTYTYIKYTDLAVGLTVGKKWVHKHNFVFEANGGIGRFLGFDEKTDTYFPRFGISVGYRF